MGWGSRVNVYLKANGGSRQNQAKLLKGGLSNRTGLLSGCGCLFWGSCVGDSCVPRLYMCGLRNAERDLS